MKRLQNEESPRVFKALMHIGPGHFAIVVVKSPGKSITVAFAKHKCFPKNVFTYSGPKDLLTMNCFLSISADEEDKFYIGQVIDNDILRWFVPTALSK